MSKQGNCSVLRGWMTVLALCFMLNILGDCLCKDKLFGGRQKYVDEFNKPDSHHPEIIVAKKYFISPTSKISRASYEEIVLAHMLGDAHGHPLRGELRQAAEQQMKGLLERYLNTKKNQESFSLDDL